MNIAKTTTTLSLPLSDARTYAWSAAFVACNIALPQLCHLVPGGGLVWLPIYLFTLVAAYKFGLAAGLLTALLSPIANNLGFGMPPAAMLPVILCKSVLLAVAASMIARRVGRVTLLGVAAAVVAYQAAGTLAEWAITGSLAVALQDIRIGWPGLLLQVFGGCLIMNMIGKKAN